MLINEDLAAELSIDQSYIASETARQLEEIERRREIYFGNSPPAPLVDRTVIIVDDGIATGSTMGVALRAVKKSGAKRVVLAVPVAPHDARGTGRSYRERSSSSHAYRDDRRRPNRQPASVAMRKFA